MTTYERVASPRGVLGEPGVLAVREIGVTGVTGAILVLVDGVEGAAPLKPDAALLEAPEIDDDRLLSFEGVACAVDAAEA